MSKKRREGEAGFTGGKQPVIEGCSVVLYGGDQRILVRDVKSLGRSKYKGVIFGFSPSFAHEYQGLKVGDDLLFDTDDIIIGD